MRFRLPLLVILFFSTFSIGMAQSNVYDRYWKQIDTLLLKDKLPESATRLLDKVYALAKKEGRQDQLLKTLVYRLSLLAEKEEDSDLLQIRLLEKEQSSVTGAGKFILQSMLATAYKHYFEQVGYEIGGRTATVKPDPKKPETWSAADFHRKITQLYTASLKDEALLKKTSLSSYEVLLIKGNVRRLRPTLYDLLAHEALNYFESGQSGLSDPEAQFEIRQPEAFEPAVRFVNRKFNSPDSLSLQHKALQLYQQLIAFHLTDKEPDALLDVDLKRLAFVHENAVLDTKEALYKNSLIQLTTQYGQLPAASQAWYLLAKIYDEGIDDESAEAEDLKLFKRDRVKARLICEQVVAQKEESAGKWNCQHLLEDIKRPFISIEAEKVNLPAAPFRVLLGYANTPVVYARILQLGKSAKEILKQHRYEEDTLFQQLVTLESIRPQETINLPGTSDHITHNAEWKVDGLPSGEYGLLLSNDPAFRPDSAVFSFISFHVSGIAYLKQQDEFYVLDRNFGKPLSKANVQVWYNVYNETSREYSERRGENIITDNNGRFRITAPKTKNNNEYRLEITTPNDRLALDQQFYIQSQRESDARTDLAYWSYMYTDRAIYRPGQTVYFKAIVLQSPEIKSSRKKPATGFRTTIILQDANGMKIDSLDVTTNSFGSCSGKFNLPTGKLNGRFNIVAGGIGLYHSISVEEYKRPKFSVELKPLTGTYKLNEKLEVNGQALAYAGNAIGGAKVVYRVERSMRNRIYDPAYSRGWVAYPPLSRYGFESNRKEIAHGEITTDANGNFRIPFTATADAKVDRKWQPVFAFTVHADVTDINGETRSSTYTLNIGYTALQLDFDLTEDLQAASFTTIPIRVNNLNDEPQTAAVEITVAALQAPTRIFRKRYWEAPDQHLYTEKEYRSWFPLDLYADEYNTGKWPVKTITVSLKDSATGSNGVKLPRTLPAGWYKLTASTTDAFGEKITKSVDLLLTDETTSGLYQDISLVPDKTTIKTTETLSLSKRTNLDSVWVILEASLSGKTENRFENWSGTKKQALPLSTADAPELKWSAIAIKNNRVLRAGAEVTVLDPEDELDITVSTWRDKLLPGSKEKWKLQLKGSGKDKLLAEVLTTMYDRSLDQYRPNSWNPPYPYFAHQGLMVYGEDNGFTEEQSIEPDHYDYAGGWFSVYDELLYQPDRQPNWWIQPESDILKFTSGVLVERFAATRIGVVKQAGVKDEGVAYSIAANNAHELEDDKNLSFSPSPIKKKESNNNPVTPRTNFNETAFFYPALYTDSTGAFEISFEMPEALTSWKWMVLAHTQQLATAYLEKTVVTQKDLMVQSNAPRFLREGDRMDFSAKIVNMTSQELTGQIELQLVDPENNQPVDGWFRNFFPNQYFTVPANGSVPTSFTIEIPFQYNRPVIARLIARSGNFSDGEAITIPVVSNRMLVTESLPLVMNGNGTKTFSFDRLKKAAESETLNHHSLSVEFTANPVWSAVQALPYLMEYPYECAEQSFNRYAANALSTWILNSNPRIKAVVDQWSAYGAAALQSNLQRNPELRSILLEETPWVMEARDEEAQRKQLADLLDLKKASDARRALLQHLQEMQLSNGGFPWFEGGPDNTYITQYILTGIGHLKKQGVLPKDEAALDAIVRKALPYLDARLFEQYNALVKQKAKLAEQQPDYYALQYLYMRSFFRDQPVEGKMAKVLNYWRGQAARFWQKQNKYGQAMIALALFRSDDVNTATAILRSLEQQSLYTEATGRYWKDFTRSGYYWYQANIEAHSLLTEAFWEIRKDLAIDRDLKIWLLRQKQTTHWPTTKATAEACYVLLATGQENWVNSTPTASITLGSQPLKTKAAEAGSGYIKGSIDPKTIKPAMGDITVTLSGVQGQFAPPAYGAVYWQYFEDLTAITPAATGIQLKKHMYVQVNTDRGPVLNEVKEGESLHVGDKVKVRIELSSDRDLEFVHLKDMRAAALEPEISLSGYQWQGGLGYYQSTKDASTNFFFDRIRKGKYVFEYTLFVTHTGTFSNGISTVQCMYAPEFTSHSEGVKITVESSQ